jgi:Flp pilus assembly protein TadG
MNKIIVLKLKKFGRRQEGAVAVEFALVLTLLLLIVGGVVDFGHYFYLRQVATNASREGARYGAAYDTPRITEAQIRDYIQKKYGPSLGYSDVTQLLVNAPAAGGVTGTDLTVTVTGSKDWFLLEGLVSRISTSEALHHPSGSTVMKLE